MREIVPKIIRNAPNCIILAATNPVDVITKVILDISKFPSNRVIGSGTVLDTARFRAMLSDYFNVSPHSIHAYVMGDNIGNISLFCLEIIIHGFRFVLSAFILENGTAHYISHRVGTTHGVD